MLMTNDQLQVCTCVCVCVCVLCVCLTGVVCEPIGAVRVDKAYVMSAGVSAARMMHLYKTIIM